MPDAPLHSMSMPIPPIKMTETVPPAAEQLFRENGRLYQMWPRDRYLLPADQTEQDRLDIYSQLFKILLGNKFHSGAAKLDDNCRILDVGCGTGHWVISMAHDLHPRRCLVVGLDVQMTQPDLIPETVRFERADVETPWASEISRHGPYDLINCRLMKGAIRSWPSLYQKIAAHLTPVTGVFEHMEIDWTIRCNDGEVPPALEDWSNAVADAMDQHGMSIRVNARETVSMLESAGFIDVEQTEFILPVGNWGHSGEIGAWFNLALTHSTLPMCLAPLYRLKKRSLQYITELNKAVHLELSTQSYTDGVYCKVYRWTARVPRRG